MASFDIAWWGVRIDELLFHSLQLQNELGRSLVPGAKPKGMFGTFMGIFRHEGAAALYSGLGAAIVRQAIYGGIGIGFYQPVRCVLPALPGQVGCLTHHGWLSATSSRAGIPTKPRFTSASWLGVSQAAWAS